MDNINIDLIKESKEKKIKLKDLFEKIKDKKNKK